MHEIFSSRSLLAMQSVLFIAYHGRFGNPVKSYQMVARYRLNNRALEPILQILTRAGILESKQGINGGYLIARPHKITLADVAVLFLQKPGGKILVYNDFSTILLPFFEEAYQQALKSLSFKTVADLVCEAAAQAVPSLNDASLDFMI